MLTQTFEYNGVAFTVRQPTIFDDEMGTVAWVDICRLLAKEAGLPSTDDLPLVTQRLAKRYIEWMQVTALSGQETPAFGNVYAPDAESFKIWRDAILANGQALALKWSQAYTIVAQSVPDESEKKDAQSNGIASDELPDFVPTETS